MKRFNQKGTTSMAEYVLTIFLVIATITMMTTYVKRAFQARQRDARHFMISQTSEACDCFCKQASGLINSLVNCETPDGNAISENIAIGEQYEPYYAMMMVNSDRESSNSKGTMLKNSIVTINSQGITSSESFQLAPKDAAQDKVLSF